MACFRLLHDDDDDDDDFASTQAAGWPKISEGVAPGPHQSFSFSQK